jgi:hypothetical protein
MARADMSAKCQITRHGRFHSKASSLQRDGFSARQVRGLDVACGHPSHTVINEQRAAVDCAATAPVSQLSSDIFQDSVRSFISGAKFGIGHTSHIDSYKSHKAVRNKERPRSISGKSVTA